MQNPLKDIWQGPVCPDDGAAWQGILCFYDRVAVVNLDSMNLIGKTVSFGRLAVPSGRFESKCILLCCEHIIMQAFGLRQCLIIVKCRHITSQLCESELFISDELSQQSSVRCERHSLQGQR